MKAVAANKPNKPVYKPVPSHPVVYPRWLINFPAKSPITCVLLEQLIGEGFYIKTKPVS
jgi:hypothetical protein